MESLKQKNSKGAVTIVEATFILPITFFVVFMLLFFGNAIFVKANVDSLVSRYTIKAAAEASNPMLVTLNKTGSLPTKSASVDTQPYRYITSGYANSVSSSISSGLKNDIKKYSGFFIGMNPKIEKCTVKYHNYFIYQTMETTVEYKIKLPIRIIFTSDNYVLHFVAKDEQALNDTSEFILNMNMVLDYYEGSALEEKVNEASSKLSEAFGKLKDAIGKFL